MEEESPHSLAVLLFKIFMFFPLGHCTSLSMNIRVGRGTVFLLVGELGGLHKASTYLAECHVSCVDNAMWEEATYTVSGKKPQKPAHGATSFSSSSATSLTTFQIVAPLDEVPD